MNNGGDPQDTPRGSMPEPVYLPSNEPYLGQDSVLLFDKIIVKCLDVNARTAAYTHEAEFSDLQKAACQIIPQGVNLALATRELVSQGYLFAALVLLRPLIERAAIISHLRANPEDLDLWASGWKHGKRPDLAKMLKSAKGSSSPDVAAQTCSGLNHLIHGDPFSADWNLVELGDGGLGYSVSKVTNDPSLCAYVCLHAACHLVVLSEMMEDCFPEAQSPVRPPRPMWDPANS